MKKLLGLLLTTSSAFAGQGFTSFPSLQNRNFHPNPSAERGTGGMTVSNVTMTRDTDPADKFNGMASYALTSATHTAFIRTDDIPLDKPYADGGNCEAQVYYKGDGSKWQLEIRPSGGGSVLVSTPLASSTGWSRAAVNYPCATNLRIYVTSTASSPADLNVAGFYWGPATNVGTFAQATKFGTLVYNGGTNCQWERTNAAFGDFAADTDCTSPVVTGSVTAPATKIPGFTATFPPGEYMVVATGMLTQSGATGTWSYRMYDGTTAFGQTGGSNFGGTATNGGGYSIVGHITYPTTTTATINIQGRADTGTAVIANTFTSSALTFMVYRFPSSSETAYSPPGNTWGSALLSKASLTSSQFSTTTPTSFNNAGYTGYTFVGSAVTTTTSGDLGIKIPNLAAGTYEITAQGGFYSGAASSCIFSIYDGTTRDSSGYVGSNSGYAPTLRGTFTYTAAGDRNFVVQAHSLSSSTLCGVDVGDGTAGAGSTFRITVSPVNAAYQTPLLMGSLSSTYTGALREEYVRVDLCTGSPCTVNDKSGDWISSVSRGSSGSYAININSGVFSAAPSCTVTTTRGNALVASTDVSVNTSTYFYVGTYSSGTLADGGFIARCIGKR